MFEVSFSILLREESRNECHTPLDFLSCEKKIMFVLLSLSAIKIFHYFVPHVTEIIIMLVYWPPFGVKIFI